MRILRIRVHGVIASVFCFSSLFLVFFSHLSSFPAETINRHCNFTNGRWEFDPSRRALYNEECPFHRNAWNCGKNKRPGMDQIASWKWIPIDCELPIMEPHAFLNSARNMRFGFVGDSLNENFLVAFLCRLSTADPSARKWKRKGAWRGAYFPSFNVTVAYHRSVLLARYYELQEEKLREFPLREFALKKAYRVDVDVPAAEWDGVLEFYDVFVFNTGHWWTQDKFPKNSPLIFYERDKLIQPMIEMKEGLGIVMKHMVAHIERRVPVRALKLWRTQSPRHFYGGDWNQNGTCTDDRLLSETEVEEWFREENGGINKEAREINEVIKREVKKAKSIELLDVSKMSEYRRDAHPAIWLGSKDAHLVWGQDCMHWCLPGVPDTWVDILAAIAIASRN